MFLAIQKKTKVLLVAEEAQNEEDMDQNNHDSGDADEDADEDDSARPSKRTCTNTRLSMDEEELSYAKQFQHPSTFTDLGHNSVNEQAGRGEDSEEDQQNKEDNLMNIDQDVDAETNILGGGESNGVCGLSYYIISNQFPFPSC